MEKGLQNIRTAWESLYREILCSPKYTLLALIFATLVFIFSVWLPNFGLIRDVLFSNNFTFLSKIIFLWNSLGAITTEFSALSATLLVVISVLFGLNISLTVYYFKRRVTLQKAGGMSIAGMIAGLIGLGCASCGSVILSTFLGVGATAAFTGFLPFGGQEFSILAIIILVASLYVTGKKIADLLVCSISPQG